MNQPMVKNPPEDLTQKIVAGCFNLIAIMIGVIALIGGAMDPYWSLPGYANLKEADIFGFQWRGHYLSTYYTAYIISIMVIGAFALFLRMGNKTHKKRNTLVNSMIHFGAALTFLITVLTLPYLIPKDFDCLSKKGICVVRNSEPVMNDWNKVQYVEGYGEPAKSQIADSPGRPFMYRFTMVDGQVFEYPVNEYIIPLNRVLRQNHIEVNVDLPWRSVYEKLTRLEKLPGDEDTGSE